MLRLGSHVSSAAPVPVPDPVGDCGGVARRRSDITMRGGIIHPVIKIAHIGYYSGGGEEVEDTDATKRAGRNCLRGTCIFFDSCTCELQSIFNVLKKA